MADRFVPVPAGSGDAEVDQQMGSIRQDFGEGAAQGKAPEESAPARFQPVAATAPSRFVPVQAPQAPTVQPKATEAKPGVLSKIKNAITPHMTMDEALNPALGQSALAFGLATGAAVPGPLPLKAAGFVAGAASAYLFAEAEKREFEKFKAMGETDEDAHRYAAISTTVLGLGTGLAPHPSKPRGVYTASPPEPPAPGGSAVDLARFEKLPGVGGSDDIRSLAQAAQSEQLGAAPSRPPGPAIPAPGMPQAGPVTQRYGPELNPTGSVVRPDKGVDPGLKAPGQSAFYGSDLQPLDTGSLLRKKADLVTAQKPYEQLPPRDETVPLPSMKAGPRDAVETPDNPRVDLSAEELLQKRQAQKSEVLPTAADLERTQDPTLYEKHRREIAQQNIIIAEKKREFFEHTRQGGDPATLSTDTVSTAGQGVPSFYDGLTGSSAKGSKLPSAWIRASTQMDREIGNTGKVGRDIELQLHEMNAKPERMLDQWKTNSLVPILDRWFGRTGFFKKNNPFTLPGMSKDFNISKKDMDDFVDYAYTASGRYGPVLQPKNPNVKGAVDELFSKGMGDIENHPGVRQAIIRTIDGDKPVGDPGQAFYPHNPQSPMLRQGMTGKVLGIAYDQAKAKGWKGYRYFDEATQQIKQDTSMVGFKRFLDDHPNNSFRRFNGLELGRTLDATMGGTRRPSEVLRELGYGTDPVNDLMQWAHGALRRGEQILAEPGLMQNWSKLHDELVSTSQGTGWLDTMIQRATGHDVEMADKFFGDYISKWNNATNLGLLKLSGIQQINQASYILQRFGLSSTVRGLLALPGPQKDRILQESGARVATYLQMMTKPADVFGNLLQRQLQVIGMTQIDSALRASAALSADLHIRQQLQIAMNPAVQARPILRKFFERNLTGILRENNLPESEIQQVLKTKELTMDQRLKIAQNGANFTQGRVGYRGQPAVLADWTAPLGRLTRNLKNFMFSNWVEDARALNEAKKHGVPAATIAARAARGIAGGLVAGDITNTITHGIKDFINQTETPQTPKWLTDTFGDTGGRLAGDLAAGKGHIVASMILATSDSMHEFVAQTLLPAAIALPARDFDKLVMAWSKGNADYALNVISKYVYGGNIVPPPKPNRQGSGMPNLGVKP